ncbi:MAG: NAD(P)-dependent oxidoreductase [Candidatus Roizmanbacteria bacterium]
MAILITGATGVIGSFLLNSLKNRFQVLGIARSSSNTQILSVDLSNITKNDVNNLLNRRNIQVIIHCAAKLTILDELDSRFNESALKPFFDNPMSKKIKFIVLGSASEYGIISNSIINESTPPNPITSYGISKLKQTKLCEYYRNLGYDITVLRLFNIVSQNSSIKSLTGSIREQYLNNSNPTISLPSRSIQRDFIDLRDISDAITQIISASKAEFLYNIASGKLTTYGEYVDIVNMCAKKYNLPKISINITNEVEKYSNSHTDISLAMKSIQWQPKNKLIDSIEWAIFEKS